MCPGILHREVYFTADIDLAYADMRALGGVLRETGFRKKGRYWVHEDLKLAVESPAPAVVGNPEYIEVVELGKDLRCWIIGLEDLIIDRLNACKH